MTDRTTIVVRLTPALRKKLERLTRRSRKQLGGSWSRNDQICYILSSYTDPDDDDPPAHEARPGD